MRHLLWLRIIYKKRHIPLFVTAGVLVFSPPAWAIQLHASGGGIITHQIGHLFFLFSMVVLIFTIRDKRLDLQKGWRMIQYAAFFFILWNLDTIIAHFLDNQIQIVSLEPISYDRMVIETQGHSPVLSWVYYFLKLDHLLCVPAMVFLYLGLSSLVKASHERNGAR